MRSEGRLAAALWVIAALGGRSKQPPPGEGVAATPSRNAPSLTTKSTAASPAQVREVSAATSAAEPALIRLPQTEVTWSYPDTPVGPMNAVVVVPERAAEERFPV